MTDQAKRCWLLHTWGKWEQITVSYKWMPYEGHSPIEGVKDAQKRVCERCGFIQRRDVSRN